MRIVPIGFALLASDKMNYLSNGDNRLSRSSARYAKVGSRAAEVTLKMFPKLHLPSIEIC
jgi:hypothetical protein